MLRSIRAIQKGLHEGASYADQKAEERIRASLTEAATGTTGLLLRLLIGGSQSEWTEWEAEQITELAQKFAPFPIYKLEAFILIGRQSHAGALERQKMHAALLALDIKAETTTDPLTASQARSIVEQFRNSD